MKKVLLSLCVMFMMFQLHAVAADGFDYKKYGSIAVAVVNADYPKEDVTDYKYEGRKKVNDKDVVDSFLFIVKENGKEKKVRVKIQHNLTNDKLLTLTVEEPN